MNALLKTTRRIVSNMFGKGHQVKLTNFSVVKKKFSVKPNAFYSPQRFYFGDKPPRGFEKFDRKKKQISKNESNEVPDKDDKKKEDKEKDSDKKAANDENEKKDEKSKSNKSESEQEENEDKKKSSNQNNNNNNNNDNLINTMLLAAITALGLNYYLGSPTKEITMIEFFNLVSSKRISKIDIAKDNESSTFFKVICHLQDGSHSYLTIVNNDQFLQSLEMKQLEMGINPNDFIPLKYVSHFEPEDTGRSKLMTLLFLISILGYRIMKKPPSNLKNFNNLKGGGDKSGSKKSSGSGFGGGLGNIFDIGKSNVKEYGVETKVNTKFKQVAGMEQAKKEIVEFVDFLKHPDKYHKLGAKIPRGALLVGPPGTGKTLLAKAVAGEADVPFFAISGSDFVEMFVGVGASRVRDLFKKAKEKAPSIVFIDEIDAVGRKRGGKFSGGHDERESTLNQLLVEMDGFSTEANVIVLAATNRKDILDPALLRPGRFDRTVEINLPDRKEREEILKIYLKKIKLDTTKSVDEYASRISTLTPGFSGADISNLVNEAAIISARENLESVNSSAFERASERIIAGLETKRILTEKERKTVAYHEAGHAVVGWFMEYSNPLVKVTIIPRSKGALGFTQYIPDDISLHTKEQLYDLMCVALGGRMAEEKFFGTITTGASDDLQRVTNIANSIVTRFGMSKLGLSAYTFNEEGFVKPYSTITEAEIEKEVKSIIDECAARTREYISKYSEKIEIMAQELLKKETLDLLDIIACIGDRPFPLPDSIREYLDEIKNRREQKEKEAQAAKEKKEKEEKEEKEEEKGEKSEENKEATDKDTNKN